jgi:hypothetical protein
MVLDPLPENVTTTVITPYLELKLLPKSAPGWDLVTNNNWIKVENAFLELEEQVSVVRHSMDAFDAKIVEIKSDVENEAIIRYQEDQLRALHTRFSHRALTASSATAFTHSLGMFPQVSVIREIGLSQGVDVTNAFDTLITHTDANQVTVTVGVSGTYTIICVA